MLQKQIVNIATTIMSTSKIQNVNIRRLAETVRRHRAMSAIAAAAGVSRQAVHAAFQRKQLSPAVAQAAAEIIEKLRNAKGGKP